MLEQKNEPSQVEQANRAKLSYEQDKEAKRLERQRQRRIEEIEQTIESLETLLAQNEQLLCDPDVYQDHEKVLTINKENEQTEKQLTELLDEWTHLSE